MPWDASIWAQGYQIVIIIFKWLRVWKRKNILLSEFIQYLKDKPYIKLYKAARLAEINMRREMRIFRYSPFYLDRE